MKEFLRLNILCLTTRQENVVEIIEVIVASTGCAIFVGIKWFNTGVPENKKYECVH